MDKQTPQIRTPEEIANQIQFRVFLPASILMQSYISQLTTLESLTPPQLRLVEKITEVDPIARERFLEILKYLEPKAIESKLTDLFKGLTINGIIRRAEILNPKMKQVALVQTKAYLEEIFRLEYKKPEHQQVKMDSEVATDIVIEELERAFTRKDNPVVDCSGLTQFVKSTIENVGNKFDGLSGLLGRKAFSKQMNEMSVERMKRTKLVFMDMAALGLANVPGQQVGDDAIVQCASVFKQLANELKDENLKIETIRTYRLGGDEFAFEIVYRDEQSKLYADNYGIFGQEKEILADKMQMLYSDTRAINDKTWSISADRDVLDLTNSSLLQKIFTLPNTLANEINRIKAYINSKDWTEQENTDSLEQILIIESKLNEIKELLSLKNIDFLKSLVGETTLTDLAQMNRLTDWEPIMKALSLKPDDIIGDDKGQIVSKLLESIEKKENKLDKINKLKDELAKFFGSFPLGVTLAPDPLSEEYLRNWQKHNTKSALGQVDRLREIDMNFKAGQMGEVVFDYILKNGGSTEIFWLILGKKITKPTADEPLSMDIRVRLE